VSLTRSLLLSVLILSTHGEIANNPRKLTVCVTGNRNSTTSKLGAGSPGCYNVCMPKEDAPKKKVRGSKSKNAASKASKDEDDDAAPEPIELEAVKSKKGEPDDNLKRRAEWFQKRTGG
jgi:hypothetical protein